MRILLPALLLLSLTMAGCVQDRADAPTVGDGTEIAVEPDRFSLSLTGCQEAGSVAVYTDTMYRLVGSGLPEPWQRADIRDEIGDPPSRRVERATGHWHMAIVCEEGPSDGGSFAFGWVGIEVEAPAWDTGGAARHVLLSGWTLPDASLRAAVEDVSGFEPTETVRATIREVAPEIVEAIHQDAVKGTYEAMGPVLPYREKEDHVVRWWLQVETEDGVAPVWFDLRHVRGTVHEVSGEDLGLGCHTGTHMHGPQGGLCGEAVIARYLSPTLHLSYGGRADVVLDHLWVH